MPDALFSFHANFPVYADALSTYFFPFLLRSALELTQDIKATNERIQLRRGSFGRGGGGVSEGDVSKFKLPLVA